jgi:uncharacterized membrane protein YuzA (DUF378 family)
MNTKQILGIVGSINGGLITGAALLQTLFGQDLTIKIVAVLGIGQIIVSALSSQLSNQENLVKDVAAMPGVQRIAVNESASPALAAVAISADQPKVGATSPEVRASLQTIATKG